MFHHLDALSPRIKFWLGFACVPLIIWIALGLGTIVLLCSRAGHSSHVLGLFLFVGGPLFLGAASAFVGFCTAFFWHHLLPAEGPEGSAGFWGLVLAWIPVVLLTGVGVLVLFPLLVFLFYFGLWHGYSFWNSKRSRQWLGDFSDMS